MSKQKILNTIYQLQQKYKHLHVGGSIGLYLLGFDLKREWKDVDMCSSENIDLPNECKLRNEFSSNGNDFDYNITRDGIIYEIKIAEQRYNKINYAGRVFNVTDIEVILFYKKSYADKGYEKHANDLAIINYLKQNV